MIFSCFNECSSAMFLKNFYKASVEYMPKPLKSIDFRGFCIEMQIMIRSTGFQKGFMGFQIV